MGNLDGRKTDGITGAKGPAIVLRSLFAELNKHAETKKLYLSPELVQKEIHKNGGGLIKTEFFIAGTEPVKRNDRKDSPRIGFLKPVNGLEMAMDPRIPDKDEAFEFVVTGVDYDDLVTWYVDGVKYGETKGGSFLWNLQKGRHSAEVSILKKGSKQAVFDRVIFIVK